MLEGSVPDKDAMDLAWTVARTVSGVDGVRSRVRLVDATAEPNSAVAKQVEAKIRDAVLSCRIRLALIDEWGSAAIGIGADVTNGAVTLEFGPDTNLPRRQDVVDAVKGMDGVASVKSVGKK